MMSYEILLKTSNVELDKNGISDGSRMIESP